MATLIPIEYFDKSLNTTDADYIEYRRGQKFVDLDAYILATSPPSETAPIAFGLSEGTVTIGGFGYTLDPFGGNDRGDGAVDFQRLRYADTRVASGRFAFIAGGNNNTASGNNSHAEGTNNTASGFGSHAEGSGNTSSGDYSHAEGSINEASGNSSHAEGQGNIASGDYSHVEGESNTASGTSSHVEGAANTASGDASHVGGQYATIDSAAVPGSPAATDHLLKYGNGTSTGARADAFVMTRAGNWTYYGTEFVYPNMPTSSAGLPSGALWNNSGVVNIV